uniref:Uncharacterized protein n=1 Tax=Neogobius melanostomus TaxID=47308 RepID=A0A8C6WGP2_9GOBI
MSSVSCTLSGGQFLCSICLEVFSAPVITPCGHSFCRACINQHWDNSDHCNCPVCKQAFNTKPKLKVNIVLAEMVLEFKGTPQADDVVDESVILEQQSAAKEVVCDVSAPAVEVCLDCTSADHKYHKAVPLKEDYEVQLTEVKEQIKERLQKIEEIRGSVELSQKNADTEIQEGIRVFNTLMQSLQQSLDSFKQSIEEKHKRSEEEAAELIEQIQAEISVLEQRGAEMEQQWSLGDHLQFVQTFTSAKPAPQFNNWTGTGICATYDVMLAEAVSKLQNNQLRQDLRNVLVPYIKRFQQYAVDVKLDGDTAHRNIWLDNYSTKVQYKEKEKGYYDDSDRFSSYYFVLGQQAFSSGKFYFEVTVKGSRNWSVGVVKESVERKRNIPVTPSNGFWLIKWNDEKKHCEVGVENISLTNMPYKIGVFVDYEEGLVCFFDVHNAALITSLECYSFTESLLPLISPGNRGAMHITSVQLH